MVVMCCRFVSCGRLWVEFFLRGLVENRKPNSLHRIDLILGGEGASPGGFGMVPLLRNQEEKTMKNLKSEVEDYYYI